MIELPFRFPWRVFLRCTAAGVVTLLILWACKFGAELIWGAPAERFFFFNAVLSPGIPWLAVVLPAVIATVCLWLFMGRSRQVWAVAPLLALANTDVVLCLVFRLAFQGALDGPEWPMWLIVWFYYLQDDTWQYYATFSLIHIVISLAYLLPPYFLLRPHMQWTWLLGGWLWASSFTWALYHFALTQRWTFHGDPFLWNTIPLLYLACLPWLLLEAHGDDWRKLGKLPLPPTGQLMDPTAKGGEPRALLPFRFPWQVFWRCTTAGVVAAIVAAVAAFELEDALSRLLLGSPASDDQLPAIRVLMAWYNLFMPAVILTAGLWWLGFSRYVWCIAPAVVLANALGNAHLLVRVQREIGLWLHIGWKQSFASAYPSLSIDTRVTIYWLVPLILSAAVYLIPTFLLPRPKPHWVWLFGTWCCVLAMTVALQYALATIGLKSPNLYLSLAMLPVYLAGLPWLIAEARGDDWRRVGRPPSAVDCASNES